MRLWLILPRKVEGPRPVLRAFINITITITIVFCRVPTLFPSNPFSGTLSLSVCTTKYSQPLLLSCRPRPLHQSAPPSQASPSCLFQGLGNPSDSIIEYYEVSPVSGATTRPGILLATLVNVVRELKWLRRCLYECFSVHLHRAG